jgi:hypothetical protein
MEQVEMGGARFVTAAYAARLRLSPFGRNHGALSVGNFYAA